MVKLTENIIYGRTKTATESVRRLNLWGCDIDDISLCEKMPNLEILSLSVNRVQILQPLKCCSNLQELYLRKNEVSDLRQLDHLTGLEQLRVLWLEENPCSNDPSYRSTVLRILPHLTMLDNTAVTQEEVNAAQKSSQSYEEVQPRSRQSSLERSVMSTSITSSDNEPSARVFDVIPGNSEYTYISPPDEMTASVSASQYYECISNSLNDTRIDQDTTPVTEVCAHLETEVNRSNLQLAYYDPLAPPSAVSFSGTMNVPAEGSSAISPDTSAAWADFSLEDIELSRSYHVGSASARTHREQAQHPNWYSRSVSVPRRRGYSRSRSASPVRLQKNENIVAAIAVLMDELDQSSLRTVIEEAQRRIKKQR